MSAARGDSLPQPMPGAYVQANPTPLWSCASPPAHSAPFRASCFPKVTEAPRVSYTDSPLPAHTCFPHMHH